MWTPLQLSIFRIKLRENPDTAAVVGVIIEREAATSGSSRSPRRSI